MITESTNKPGKITNNAFNPCSGALLRRLHPRSLFSEKEKRTRSWIANSKTERVRVVKHVKLDTPNARKAAGRSYFVCCVVLSNLVNIEYSIR